MIETFEPLKSQLEGRSFSGTRKVRLGDVDSGGLLRLDALTRYTQDVSDDDTTDAGLDSKPGWIVRSTVVDELQPARLAEELHFVTFCSGVGKRWAERRLTVTGSRGARYEVATIWVCVDTAGGQLQPLTDQFLAVYGTAAAGRSASARLSNPKLKLDSTFRPLPRDNFDSYITEEWQLRRGDFDVQQHVNNAAYWAAVNHWLPASLSVPRRCRLEYGEGISVSPSVLVTRATQMQPPTMQGPAIAGTFALWWRCDAAAPKSAASFFAFPLPVDLYQPNDR